MCVFYFFLVIKKNEGCFCNGFIIVLVKGKKNFLVRIFCL